MTARPAWSLLAALAWTAAAGGGEAGRGGVYSVVEIPFAGPILTAKDAPARDVDLRVTFRHEGGTEYTLPGFWDGDGKGGTAGGAFKVRFCPTKPGRWELTAVRSNAKQLDNQRQGDFVTATPSAHPGFWVADADSPGRRWYKRSDGSHQYIFGNTQYSFLSGMRDARPVPGFDIAADVAANADYFKKLRFGLCGDRYVHPTDKPFLDAEGKPTDKGDCSVRPNPKWFRERVDVAVKAAYDRDLIADLILAGPDTEDSRATLRAGENGGDPTPFLKYVAARYGSFPNVWMCLCNEYDIKTPKYPVADIARFGAAMKAYLPYPTPLSVHASTHPDGRKKDGNEAAQAAWSATFEGLPPWHDHQILQRKIRAVAPSADAINRTWENKGGKGPLAKPTVNDELSYQGAGDKHTEGDTLASHLGAFAGGGYASTGFKPVAKQGHYFWGKFTPEEHTAAKGLKYLREAIDKNVTFWKMAPDATIFPGLDPAFRALAWPGREYALATDKAATGVVAELPPGVWAVTAFDAAGRAEKVLSEQASGRFAFDSPDSRAALIHFKKVDANGAGKVGAIPRTVFDVDLTKGDAGPGVVTGGQWDGGWRLTGRKGERIVFDAGKPIANGCLEVRVTTPRKPWGDGASGKINWCGLYEDGRLTQSAHTGDLFYARVGSQAYKFSNVKAAGQPFDRTEHEPRLGSADDWVADDKTVMAVKLEWRDGLPIFTDAKGQRTVFPRDVIGGDSPVDRLRYAFLGSDRFTELTVPGLRFLSAKLTDYGPAADAPPPERLKVHENGRNLVNEAGRPVFLLADTAWGLAVRLNRDDTTKYLLHRRGQRFNAVAFLMHTAKGGDIGGPANASGASPFAAAGGPPDPSAPAAKEYWDHVDFVVRECKRLGLYALVHPCWGSDIVGPPGPRLLTPEAAYAYGRQLGGRYGREPHLIWVLGGDKAPVGAGFDSRPAVRAMAEGIADGVRGADARDGKADYSGVLMTYHPPKVAPRSAEWFHADPWESFDSIQAWPEVQAECVTKDLALTPAKPSWLFEGRYEGYFRRDYKAEQWGEWQCRQQAYQTAFAGAFGHTYGHERIYGFGKEGADWKAYLDAPGAKSMTHLARLMNAFAPQVRLGMAPDQSLIDGDEGKAERLRSDRITAFRSESRGGVAAFYTANGRPVRVRADKLVAGPMNAWWFNPRTGGWATSKGESPEMAIHTPGVSTGPGTPVREFAPPGPSGDGNDWVLILGKNPALY